MTAPETNNQPLFDRLDGDEPRTDGSTFGPSLEGCDTEELADHLFLDSLLREVYAPGSEATRARVDQAIARLHRPRLRLIRTRRYSALAAALLVFTGALWLLLGVTSPTAHAALARALESAQVAADRLYHVVVERSLPGPIRVEASLYVNGGRKFAVAVHDMPTGTLWAGSNGGNVWLVPAFPPFPVFVSDNPRLMSSLLSTWMEKQDVQLPFLQITKVLENMQRAYDIEFLESSEPEADSKNLVSVIGRKRVDDPLWPATIRLHSRADSGTVQQVVLEWDQSGGLPTPRTMTFTLTDEQPRPPDWYDHGAHHGPGRRLQEF